MKVILLSMAFGLMINGAALAGDPAALPPKHPSAALAAMMARADAEARVKGALATPGTKLSVTCSMCYSCGTTWPIFAGTFETTHARERTANCASGPIDLDGSD